jgi:HTH-type transcriptional regulator/antitoxin HigA
MKGIIKTEEQYQEALNQLEAIFDAPIGSAESDEADFLVLLIDDYEQKHYPIETPALLRPLRYEWRKCNSNKKT